MSKPRRHVVGIIELREGCMSGQQASHQPVTSKRRSTNGPCHLLGKRRHTTTRQTRKDDHLPF